MKLTDAVAKLEGRGHRAAAVPVGRLSELRDHYERLSRRGVIDWQFARELLSGLTLLAPDGASPSGSLVVVATRDRIVSCAFGWRGAVVEVPVPPTYLHLRRKSREAALELAELLPRGVRTECIINAPHKLLAVRSGLARYGRNNITYIPGLGSFYWLTTVYADLPCDGGEWLEPSMMPACEGCTRCAASCPTGAIPDDRFLLRAELCVTYWNEKPGDEPFPAWLAGSAHNCLMGCLRCQLVCPENQAVLGEAETGPSFAEDETKILLRGREPEDLPEVLRAKLEEWDLLEWASLLPRNLAVHLPGAGGEA